MSEWPVRLIAADSMYTYTVYSIYVLLHVT